jgi:hypothetical protein
MPTKIPATLKRYVNMIDEIEDYRSQGPDGDGYWVHLKPGYILQPDGVHSIHEDNITQCADQFGRVEKCECQECQQILAKRASKVALMEKG